MRKRILAAGVSLLGMLLCVPLGAGTPVGWRHDGTGRFPAATPPLEWSKEANVLWKARLPGPGFGSPVVAGGRIFVVSHPAELLCLDADTGKALWQQSCGPAEVYGEEKAREITEKFDRLDKARTEAVREQNKMRKEQPDEKEKLEQLRQQVRDADQAIRALQKQFPRPGRRGEPGNAAATPAFDGKHVAAVFGNGIVTVCTAEGKRLWVKFLETPTIGFGHSASPVLAGDRLIVHLNDLVALDVNTGKELWRLPLPAAHATSLAARLGEEDVLVTPAGAIVRALDGKVLAKGKFRLSESSPVLEGGKLYASNSGQIQAFRLGRGDGGEVVLEQLWKAGAARERRTPSSLSHDGLLYAVTTGGIMEVIDEKTGEQVYKQRLPLQQVYASVTLAGSHLYVSDMRGKTVVFKPGRRYQQVALNVLEGGTGASPVFVGDRLYLRGAQHLYCLSAKKE
jgi:outer membrane protein assembly factor BamB